MEEKIDMPCHIKSFLWNTGLTNPIQIVFTNPYLNDLKFT